MAESNDNEQIENLEPETTTKTVEKTGEKLNANVTPRETQEVNKLVKEDKYEREQRILDEVTEDIPIDVKPEPETNAPKAVKPPLSKVAKVITGLGIINLLLCFAVGFLYFEIESMKSDRLSEKEIVFYPYDEANKMLKRLGYDFSAVQVYNGNMIRILNEQGKVVLPKATVHGEVPSELVVKLMTVEEMNALAE